MLLGVDVGGTFTDAVLVAPDGTTHTAKAPSTPGEQEKGVMAAVEAVLARAGARAGQVERFAHGMTVATNALLEFSQAHPPTRTALVMTDGFTDIVELGRQARPSLYRLCEAGPEPLAVPGLRFGAPERMGPDGPLRALEECATEVLIERLAQAGPEAVAVVLLHSYAHPQHERRLGELIAARLPDAHLSLSHELVGTFREYERASTTEVDAALSPLLSAYLERLGAQTTVGGLPGHGRQTARELPEVQVMQSSGGLTDARRAGAHAALTVLSGPAGGVGGALLLSEAGAEKHVLCFDMGGTSCDVCVIDGGRVAETAQREVAGRPLALPALDIHTVGAGGGSIAWRDPGGALRVGPESAGAVPGPACYGRGGERATVTDANLMLGRLLADTPLAGVSLDLEAAERAVEALARELGLDTVACAEGIVRVAETEMRRALAVMTVERGIDPRGFALMPFGGAGPLHAASMAGELGIERVLCPRACGVLSALGLAAAAPRRDVSRTVMLSGAAFNGRRVGAELAALTERASGELGGPVERVDVRYEMRYRGQSFELAVEGETDHLRTAFEEAHEQRYGYRDENAEVELVNVRVSAHGARPALRLSGATAEPAVPTSTQVVFDGERIGAQLWRGELPAGTRVQGPALCAMPESTLLVPAGWSGSVDGHGTVVLEREQQGEPNRVEAGRHSRKRVRPGRVGQARDAAWRTLDPIELQVIVGALRATCEEMGATLVKSAHSANIKERRDASTALFDRDGEMVMQAEHIPVHLGSMPAAVAAVLGKEHRPGVSWVLNDPFEGGTHLPDITVVTPVFVSSSRDSTRAATRAGAGTRVGHPGLKDNASRALIGFAASRAHHADVGGRVPGSMPADSRTLAEEGVVIHPRELTAEAIEELVAQMRGPGERRADLMAQLAANRTGGVRLAELAGRTGVRRLEEAMDAVLDYAERRTRACIAALEDGVREAEDVLEAPEGDLVLRLKATVEGERLVLDFTDSAAQHTGNLNCPLAVTLSACWFAVRVLTDPDIPPSAGAYRPVQAIVPTGCVLNAARGAAVAAGNVETSSRVADLVLGAFGAALGQGTMNNLTLGNGGFTHYETLGGGQGACADADGPSGVHVAMSNTLNTPIEALERELPLRVTEYALRRGSGGAGKHRGGDGVVREVEALQDMTFSLIGERRRHAPPGSHGGEPGAPGRDALLVAGEPPQGLPAKATGRLGAGERLRIETPGGGGYGPASKHSDGPGPRS
ncbi:MAG TPA: hydantoinase B/oxoprolinase family protein [Solirubrobacteraceae bacterium]|jgi:5-oxoprolinase (ATP-hydrolysing)|nr:hydantoinase B/oxoprolinase family protein [Solirubrobacteraceae bacterium]